jgi:hypothetical protein
MVRPVPGYPNQRTSPDRPKWSGSCQKPPRLFRLRDFMRKKSVRWSATPSRTSSKVSMRASRQRSARAPNRLLYSSGGTCLPELVRLACFIQETELSELAIADLDQYFRFEAFRVSACACAQSILHASPSPHPGFRVIYRQITLSIGARYHPLHLRSAFQCHTPIHHGRTSIVFVRSCNCY